MSVSDSAQRIADVLAPAPPSTRCGWRWGTVAAVNSDGTMDVEVGGSTMPSVRALASAMTAQVGGRIRVDYLGTDAVVTGVRATDGYGIDFRNFGNNPITETADDTVANWAALGSGYAMYNQSILSQQPSQYGILLNFVAPNKSDVFQLWHTQRAGNIIIRGGNASGGFDYWRDVGGPQYADAAITRNTTNCSSLGTSWLSRKGSVVSLSFIDATLTSALASGGNVVIATLPSGYRPRANRYMQCIEKAGLWARITASGEVRISNRTGASYAAGSTATFSDTYWT